MYLQEELRRAGLFQEEDNNPSFNLCGPHPYMHCENPFLCAVQKLDERFLKRALYSNVGFMDMKLEAAKVALFAPDNIKDIFLIPDIMIGMIGTCESLSSEQQVALVFQVEKLLRQDPGFQLKLRLSDSFERIVKCINNISQLGCSLSLKRGIVIVPNSSLLQKALKIQRMDLAKLTLFLGAKVTPYILYDNANNVEYLRFLLQNYEETPSLTLLLHTTNKKSFQEALKYISINGALLCFFYLTSTVWNTVNVSA